MGKGLHIEPILKTKIDEYVISQSENDEYNFIYIIINEIIYLISKY